MRNILSKIAATALMATAPAFATQHYADFDFINQTATVTGAPVYGTFNLLTSGAEGNSATMAGYGGELGGNGTFSDIGGFTTGLPIGQAEVSFWFSDPLGGIDDGFKVRVRLASFGTIESGGNVSDLQYQTTILTHGYLGSILLSISQTGVLDYKIQATGTGSFNVDAGMLTVSVPDGGSTAMLLGVGVLGLAGLQRKLRGV